MLKKLLVLTLLTICLSLTSEAQRYRQVSKFRLSVGPALGTKTNFGDDNTKGKIGLGANIGLEYVFHRYWSGEVSYTYFFTGSDIVKSITPINLDIRYYFVSENPDTKYYLFGGLARVSVKTDDGTRTRTETETGINIGTGVNHSFNKEWGINAQVKYQTVPDGQFVAKVGLIKHL